MHLFLHLSLPLQGMCWIRPHAGSGSNLSSLGLNAVNALLVSNHMFQPSLVDNAFAVWSNLDIKTFKDLYFNNVFTFF